MQGWWFLSFPHFARLLRLFESFVDMVGTVCTLQNLLQDRGMAIACWRFAVIPSRETPLVKKVASSKVMISFQGSPPLVMGLSGGITAWPSCFKFRSSLKSYLSLRIPRDFGKGLGCNSITVKSLLLPNPYLFLLLHRCSWEHSLLRFLYANLLFRVHFLGNKAYDSWCQDWS